MTVDEALAVLADSGLKGPEGRSALDAMLIRIGYRERTLDRTLTQARLMTMAGLVCYFGLEGARAAYILSRKDVSR